MLEAVAKALKAALESDMGAALDVVETKWTAEGDTVALGDVVSYLLGYQPTVVEVEEAELPIVVVTAMQETPAPGSDQWGFGEGVVVAVVYWIVSADTEVECNKVAWRYGEAIDAVVRDHERLDSGIDVMGYVPETRISYVAREMPEFGASDEVFYTQMGEKRWTIRVRE